LLLMLLVCIHSIIESVLRYTFLILDTYHPDTLYLYEQGYEDLWLFFKDERGTQVKMFGTHCWIHNWHGDYIKNWPKTYVALNLKNKGKYNKHGRCYLKFSLWKKKFDFASVSTLNIRQGTL
jgi:hypothetical protein